MNTTSILSQCPVTTCNSIHQTFVNLATVPLCGESNIDLIGDIQSNQNDCENGSLNCHEFIISRPPGSLTQQFALKVGQGSGCTGELDGYFASIDGVCYTLSNGGSQTVITFSFPIKPFFCGIAFPCRDHESVYLLCTV